MHNQAEPTNASRRCRRRPKRIQFLLFIFRRALNMLHTIINIKVKPLKFLEWTRILLPPLLLLLLLSIASGGLQKWFKGEEGGVRRWRRTKKNWTTFMVAGKTWVIMYNSLCVCVLCFQGFKDIKTHTNHFEITRQNYSKSFDYFGRDACVLPCTVMLVLNPKIYCSFELDKHFPCDMMLHLLNYF